MSKDGHRIVDLNRRKAIRERCLNCSCWVVFDVDNCTFLDCPLHPFRTGKGHQGPKEREKVVRAYCLWCMAGQTLEVRKCVSITCPLFPFRMTKVDRSVEIALEKSQIAHIGASSRAKAK